MSRLHRSWAQAAAGACVWLACFAPADVHAQSTVHRSPRAVDRPVFEAVFEKALRDHPEKLLQFVEHSRIYRHNHVKPHVEAVKEIIESTDGKGTPIDVTSEHLVRSLGRFISVPARHPVLKVVTKGLSDVAETYLGRAQDVARQAELWARQGSLGNGRAMRIELARVVFDLCRGVDDSAFTGSHEACASAMAVGQGQFPDPRHPASQHLDEHPELFKFSGSELATQTGVDLSAAQTAIRQTTTEITAIMSALAELSREQEAGQADVRALLRQIQVDAAVTEARKRKAEQIAERIDAARAGVQILSAIVGKHHPKTGRDVLNIGMASVDLAATIWKATRDQDGNVKKLGKVGAAAIAGDVAGLAMAALSALAPSGPSPDQLILEQLHAIRSQIDSLRAEIHQRFDRVDTMLNELMTAVTTSLQLTLDSLDVLGAKVDDEQAAIIAVQRDVDRLMRYVSQALVAGFNRHFFEGRRQYLNYEQRTQAALPLASFMAALANFQTHAEGASSDLYAWLPPQLDPNRVVEDVGVTAVSAVNYVFAATRRILNAPLSTWRVSNPLEFAFAVLALVQLHDENPSHATLVDTDLSPIRQQGTDLQQALKSMASRPALTALATYYRDRGREVASVVEAEKRKFQWTRPWLDPWKEPRQPVGNEAAPPDFGTHGLQGCGGLRYHSYLEPIGVPIPDERLFYTAIGLRLGDLSSCVGPARFDVAETIEQAVAPSCGDCGDGYTEPIAVRGTFHLRIGTTFNGTVIAWLDGTLPDVVIPISAMQSERALMEDCWNQKCWEGTERWKDSIQRVMRRAVDSPEDQARIAELTARLVTRISGILANDRIGFYRELLGQLGRTTRFAEAVHRFAGAKALVDAQVTLSLSRALEQDDGLSAVLFGAQRLAGDERDIERALLTAIDALQKNPTGSAMDLGPLLESEAAVLSAYLDELAGDVENETVEAGIPLVDIAIWQLDELIARKAAQQASPTPTDPPAGLPPSGGDPGPPSAAAPVPSTSPTSPFGGTPGEFGAPGGPSSGAPVPGSPGSLPAPSVPGGGSGSPTAPVPIPAPTPTVPGGSPPSGVSVPGCPTADQRAPDWLITLASYPEETVVVLRTTGRSNADLRFTSFLIVDGRSVSVSYAAPVCVITISGAIQSAPIPPAPTPLPPITTGSSWEAAPAPPATPPAVTGAEQPPRIVVAAPAPEPTEPPPVAPVSMLDADVLFTRGGQIYRMNASGGDVTQLGVNPANNYSAKWSPDRTRVAFGSDRTGYNELFSMRADGSDVTNLTNLDPAQDVAPSWSPDGTRIAFASDRSGNYDVWIMRANGSTPIQLTTESSVDGSPSWSPDGTRIAFVSYRNGGPDIYVMSPDGANQRRLTFDGADNAAPSWSPDGKRLLVRKNKTGNQDIYLIEADGAGETQLTSEAAHEDYPTWSPDGSRLLFWSAGNVYMMNADGSHRVIVVAGTFPNWGAQ